MQKPTIHDADLAMAPEQGGAAAPACGYYISGGSLNEVIE